MGKIRINLDASFGANKQYYVEVDEGFVVDSETGTPSPAISGNTAIRFSTLPQFDAIEFVPVANDTDFHFEVDSQTGRIHIEFEQQVYKNVGNIHLYKVSINTNGTEDENDDYLETTLIQSYDIVNDVQFRFGAHGEWISLNPPLGHVMNGMSTVTHNVLGNVSVGYYVVIEDGAVKDEQGFTNRELDSRTSGDITVDWNTGLADNPTLGDTDETGNYIKITYPYVWSNPSSSNDPDDIIKRSGNYYLYDQVNNLIETINVSHVKHTIVESDPVNYPDRFDTIRLVPKYHLKHDRTYHITSDRGVIGDSHGFSYGPILEGDTTLDFEFHVPTVKGQLVLQMNRDENHAAMFLNGPRVYNQTGKVYLYKQGSNELVKTWDVKWINGWQNDTIPGVPKNEIIKNDDLIVYDDNRILLTCELEQGASYYVLIDADTFEDADKISYGGISDPLAWPWTVYDGPYVTSVVQTEPEKIEFTFDKVIQEQTEGGMYIYRTSDNQFINTINTSAASYTSGKLQINPGVWFEQEPLYILMDQDLVQYRGFVNRAVVTPGQVSYTSSSTIISSVPAVGSIGNTIGTMSVQFDRSIAANVDDKPRNDVGNPTTGFIRIRRTSDDSIAASYDIQSTTISTTTLNNDTVSWTPGAELELVGNESYYVTIDEGSLYASNGGKFYGITSKTAWNFTTAEVGINSRAPSLGQTDYTNVGTITVTYAENVTARTGNIYLKRTSDNVIMDQWAITDPEVSIVDNVLTIANATPLSGNTGYYIQMDEAVLFAEGSNLLSSAIAANDWSFTTGNVVIQTYVPSVGQTDYTNVDTFSLTYVENVSAQTGNITLYESIGDVQVGQWAITHPSVSIVDNVLTLTSGVQLKANTTYYIAIDAGAVLGADTNLLSAVVNWPFTTGAIAVTAYTPTISQTGVRSLDFSLQYSETVTAVSGSISLKRTSDDFVVQTWTIASALPSTSTTLNFSATQVDANTSYYIEMPAGLVVNSDGLLSQAVAEDAWSFTTGNTQIVSSVPSDNGTDNLVPFTVTFDRNITAATGNIEVRKTSDNSLVDSWAITAPEVNVTNDTITITADTVLDTTTGYYVNINPGTFVDSDGISYGGISNTTDWNFTTDVTAFVTATVPVDNTTGVFSKTMSITFNQPVVPNVGNLYLKTTVGDTLIQTIDVTTLTGSGATSNVQGVDYYETWTFTTTPNFSALTEYYITTDDYCFRDDELYLVPGISSTTQWSFTTGDVTIVSTNPTDSSSGNDNLDFSITFTTDVVANVGNLYIHQTSDDALIATYNVLTEATIVGDTLTVDNATVPTPGVDYYVLTDASIVLDTESGIPFAGISDKTVFNFQVTNPYIQFRTPHSESGVSGATTFYAFWDRNILQGTGTIELRKYADDTVVHTWDASNPAQVSVSGQEMTLTASTAVLDESTQYYLYLPAGAAISTEFGFLSQGTFNKNQWQFTTAEITVNSSQKNTTTIAIDYTQADGTIVINTGNVELRKTSDNSLVQTFTHLSGDLSIVDNHILLVSNVTALDNTTSYYVLVDAGLLTNTTLNLLDSGITSATEVTFTTGVETLAVSNKVPADNDTDADTSTISIQFNHNVQADIGFISINKYSDDSLVEQLDVTGGSVVISNDLVTLNFNALTENTQYYITVDNGALVDSSTNLHYTGFTNKDVWNFSVTEPILTSSYPAAGDINATFDNFILTFDAPITERFSGKTIRLYKASDNSLVHTWDALANTGILSPTQLKMLSIPTLTQDESYYVLIDYGIVSVNNIFYTGISSTTEYTFTTPAPSLSTASPSISSSNAQYLDLYNAYFQFNRTVTAGTGNVYLKRTSDNALMKSWTEADLTFNGTNKFSFVAMSVQDLYLDVNTSYYFEVDAGIAVDPITGWNSHAVTGPSDWSFTTASFIEPDLYVQAEPVTVGDTLSFTVSNSTALVVDWGDGNLVEESSTGTVSGTTLGTNVKITNRDTLSTETIFTATGSSTFKNIDVSCPNSAHRVGIICDGQLSLLTATLDMTQLSALSFTNCSSLTTVNSTVGSAFYLTDLSYAFDGCTALTSAPDISTANVTDMSFVFRNCSSLATVPAYDYSSALTMESIFENCTALTAFSVENTPTVFTGYPDNCVNISKAFKNCTSLASFQTISFTQADFMSEAWRNCSSLTSLTLNAPLIPYNASGIRDISYIFDGCTSLTTAPTLQVSLEQETDMSFAFRNCSSLTSIPLTTSNVRLINLTSAFEGCSSITSFPAIDVVQAGNWTNAWKGCSGLTSFPVINIPATGDFYESPVNLYGAWEGCTGLTTFPPLETSTVTNVSRAWAGCTGLTTFPLLNTSAVTLMDAAWKDCSSLTTFPTINISLVTSMRETWANCTGLTSFPWYHSTNFNMSNVEDFYRTWYNCSGLVEMPYQNTAGSLSMVETWANCTAMQYFATSLGPVGSGTLIGGSATTLAGMFQGCTNLQYLPQIATGLATNWSNTFNGCASLTCAKAMYASGLTDGTNMFAGCTSLVAPDATEQALIQGGGYNYVNSGSCPI